MRLRSSQAQQRVKINVASNRCVPVCRARVMPAGHALLVNWRTATVPIGLLEVCMCASRRQGTRNTPDTDCVGAFVLRPGVVGSPANHFGCETLVATFSDLLCSLFGQFVLCRRSRGLSAYRWSSAHGGKAQHAQWAGMRRSAMLGTCVPRCGRRACARFSPVSPWFAVGFGQSALHTCSRQFACKRGNNCRRLVCKCRG